VLGLVLALSGPTAAAGADQVLFEDGSAASGLDFHHFNGMSGELYLPEIMGAGAALLDFDNDGDLDVYLVQGAMLGPGKTLDDATFPPANGGSSLTDRLLRNDLTVNPDGSRQVRLIDVSKEAGLTGGDYGMGVATGDYDNDGWVDLYVTHYGVNRLLRNTGDGRFVDVTATARVGDGGWGVSAAFVDYDRDGWLDLYVGNYVTVELQNHKPCHSPSSAADYCTPSVYPSEPDRLYRNRGDGTFEDVSVKAGIQSASGPALGVIAADFNGDGWPDIYVANDAQPNLLWLNQGDGRFRDDAVMAGAAVNMAGQAEGSMGVDAADFDGDGDEDLFMTHLTRETNTLYVNDGQGWFDDRSIAVGLAGPSIPFTSFGTGWYDFDNDGWLDLFVANGAVSIIRALSDAHDPYPLHQPNQLFLNQGGERFVEATDAGGPAFTQSEVSRGAAFGDVDDDGDTDILVTNNNGPARLLLNQVGQDRRWLGLRLLERHGRDALGARVAVHLGSGRTLWRRVRTDGSYASAHDPRVLVGLGEAQAVKSVEVHWPTGERETFPGPPLGRYTRLRQAASEPRGTAEAGPP
jgi:hypothetical protein